MRESEEKERGTAPLRRDGRCATLAEADRRWIGTQVVRWPWPVI